MDQEIEQQEGACPPIEVLEPETALTPLVFASPHSGTYYPPDLLSSTQLDRRVLRRSEDCFVDELFSAAPDLGAPLLRAMYPRAYLDLNREPYELDPDMFDSPLPKFVNTTSARVAAGLGTVARIVSSQKEIYRTKLNFAAIEKRIEAVYKPYHQTLRRLVNRARENFGFCILIDCHSMPSTGLPIVSEAQTRPVDIVLGDRNGLSCAPSVSDSVEQALVNCGYAVIRNNPYAGGFTTHHYGDPVNGVHALQIEINRALYMDEHTLQRRPHFPKLKDHLAVLMKKLAAFSAEAHPELHFQRLSAE